MCAWSLKSESIGLVGLFALAKWGRSRWSNASMTMVDVGRAMSVNCTL